MYRLLTLARKSLMPPRLKQKVQWYRVDDWGNTEMIDGANSKTYHVSSRGNLVSFFCFLHCDS
jgi:hypothetical protein